MTQSWSRLLFIVLSAGLAIAAPGCSCGDDDGTGDRPDARETADSAPDDIDAGGDGLQRSGTIAITEAAFTNPGLDTFSGGMVVVDFGDATTGNSPAPVAGYESNINGCLVQIWDVGTHTNSDAVDEGAVSVTGTSNGPFACGFNEGRGEYLCQSTMPALQMGSLDGIAIADGVITFPAGGAQTAPEMVGMYMAVQGHPNIPDGTTLPIVAQDAGDDSITVFGVTNVPAGDADSGFALFVGVGPVPGGAPFLGGAAADLNVQKAAGDVIPVIDEDFTANGQGFELVDDGAMGKYLPHNLPTDGSAATFECADADTCGAEGEGGIISAIVINGETTDAPVGALDPSDPMPAAETQYATFQCSFFVGADPPYSAELEADAMAAILGTSPTRIQTSIGRYRGAVLSDDAGTYSAVLLQGHSFVGWTDVE